MPRRSEPKLMNRIKDLRSADANLTQQALADAVGVTRQTIIALEAGGYVPSLALALRLANVFNTTVEQLFWLKE